jgi:outer membrane receptor protein involved in Fe transport
MMPEAVGYGDYGTGALPVDLPQHPLNGYDQERRQVMRKREALAGWRDSFGAIDAAVNLTWLKNEQSYRNDFYINYYHDYRANFGGAWNDYTTTRKGVTGDLVWRLNEGGRFAHQAELHLDWYDEELKGEISYDTATSDFQSGFKRRKRNVQLQDMITIAPLGGLQVTPIIRWEKLTGPTVGTDRQRGWPPGKGDLESKTTGGVSIKKTFENGWQVFGNTGTYIRFPNFYEIYGNGWGVVRGVSSIGNMSPLIPETGRNSDLGMGWQGHLSENFRGNFRLTYFRRKTDTTISLFSTPIGAQYMNGGPALFKGIELEGNLAWGRRADLQLAFTRQDAYYTTKDPNKPAYWGYPSTYVNPHIQYPGERIRVRGVPDYVVNARLNMRFFNNALSTYLEANRIGRVYLSQKGWENPLTTVNVGGSWLVAKTGPNKGLRLSFGVNDVFDKGPEQTLGSNNYFLNAPYQNVSYSPNVSYPYQGRTYYATLNWSY